MDPTQSSAFGALLKYYRLRASLSQETLAEKAAVSVEAISALERGKRRAPWVETIKRLARALRLSEQERAAFQAAAWRHRDPRADPNPTPSDTTSGPSVSLDTILPPAYTLPVPLTTLIGREREAAEVTDLLRTHPRLLILTGPGGVGKTLLALHVAAVVRDAFPDGMVYVPLDAAPDARLRAATLAHLLTLREGGGQAVPAATIARLRHQRLLLLLDNYECVSMAAPLLADLCAACPALTVLALSRTALHVERHPVSYRTCSQLTVLALSRTALHVRGATERPVAPLALPDPAYLPPIEELAHYAAVQLFVQRVREATPDFALTEANAAVVAALCACLGGLPLALELAAARARLLPLPALLADVERASDDPPLHLLDLLEGGACDLPPRQRTMRASLNWSYDLLDAAAQAVFRRLAVCAGGCTLEAATAVCTGVDTTVEPAARIDDIFGRLNVLVDNYVLTMDHSGDETRLTLPPLAQAYALCRLRDSREEDAARRRHARYFLSVVEAADEPHAGQGRAVWPARLTREADNLYAAACWAAMAGETANAYRLTDALCGAPADACCAGSRANPWPVADAGDGAPPRHGAAPGRRDPSHVAPDPAKWRADR